MRRTFIDTALRDQFERDGYLVTECFTPDEAAELLQIWRSMPSDVASFAFSATVFSRDLGYREAVHRALSTAFLPKIDACLDDYRIAYCSFIAKRPKEQRGVVQLHQDWTFVDESRFESVGFWCPLVDVVPENGCLWVVPGSHRLNRCARGFGQTRFPYTDLVPVLQESYLKAVPMKAGQAFIYSQRLFHSSQPNLTDEERIVAGALAIPRESSLLFVSKDPAVGPDELAVYHVAENFYRTHFFSAPPQGTRVGVYKDESEPISEARLCQELGRGTVGPVAV